MGSAKPIDGWQDGYGGFGYCCYSSYNYNGYNGIGKGIDKMIDPLIAKHHELPALSTERRLLFLHRGIAERQSRRLTENIQGLWAEMTAVLPFQWWHIGTTAGLILAIIAITLKRRFQKTAKYELLHPRHVREIAEALRLVKSTEDKTKVVGRWTVVPRARVSAELRLACTSLGI
jgi:hypothetical protein